MARRGVVSTSCLSNHRLRARGVRLGAASGAAGRAGTAGRAAAASLDRHRGAHWTDRCGTPSATLLVVQSMEASARFCIRRRVDIRAGPTGAGAFVSLDGLAQREQALPQSYVGLLLDREGLPTLLISSTRHGTRVTVKSLRPIAVPPGKVAQVWALPKEGAAFPIGVAVPTKPPGSTSFEMSATSEKLLANVTRLAVSFEDAPARAGATPGEFVLIGHCVKLW